jgi:hypothetical protein
VGPHLLVIGTAMRMATPQTIGKQLGQTRKQLRIQLGQTQLIRPADLIIVSVPINCACIPDPAPARAIPESLAKQGARRDKSSLAGSRHGFQGGLWPRTPRKLIHARPRRTILGEISRSLTLSAPPQFPALTRRFPATPGRASARPGGRAARDSQWQVTG